MKEGLLVSDRGPRQVYAAGDAVVPANETREHTEARMRARTALLSRERPEALKRKQTEALTGGRADRGLDNGLGGAPEGSVQPKSKAPSLGADSEERPPALSDPPQDASQPKAADGEGAQEPPEDWLEPLEEDDDEEDDNQSWEQDLLPRVNGSREVEDGSLAGESERSGSVAGSERNSSRKGGKSDLVVHRRRRRRQSAVDEEWEDWPALGEGWKRKEVFRRSGFSMGKTDTYYMSPVGDRLRSRVELAKYLAATIDLTTFDFKSGLFLDQGTLRKMRKLKKFRRMSRSVGKPSSPDFGSTPHKPRMMQARSSPSPQRSTGRANSVTTTPPRPVTAPPRPTPAHLATLPGHTPPQLAPIGLSSTPHSPLHHGQRRPTLKQEAGSPDCTQPELPAPGCSSCGGPVADMGPWRKRQTSLCLKCKGKGKCDSPNIIFRKWLPCGQCRACLVTENCGMCASCRNGQLNRDNCKPVRCRKRKCLCPIRKKTAKEKMAEKAMKKLVKLEEPCIAPEVNKVEKVTEPCPNNKESESEFTICIDAEDEDQDQDQEDDEDDFQRNFDRPCGSCSGCLRATDCGYCDACADLPKWAVRGKSRRPCRLRQCQRPAELVHHIVHEGWMGLGSPRPHYSSSSHWGKRKPFWDDLEFSEGEDEDDIAGAGTPGDYKLQQEVDKDTGGWTSQNCFKADSRKLDVVKASKSSAGVPDTCHSVSNSIQRYSPVFSILSSLTKG